MYHFSRYVRYSYGDYEELVNNRVFGESISRDSVIWRDKYVIKQGLELLWYAKGFIVYLKEKTWVFSNYQIRNILMKKINLSEIEFALSKLKLPPGCGRSRKFAVFFFLSLLIYEEKNERLDNGTITADDLKTIYTYGMQKSVLEYDNEFRCELRSAEETKCKTFLEAIENLREELKHLKEQRSLEQAKERECLCRFFSLPNNIFHLGLDGGEILVYAYLRYCEDRKTYKCHPSFATIGEAVGMSKKTVEKYVRGLEDKRLITTNRTTVKTKDGRIRNGSLEYHIRPIQEAVDCYDERQMAGLYRQKAASDAQKRLEEYDRKHGRTEAPENTVQ